MMDSIGRTYYDDGYEVGKAEVLKRVLDAVPKDTGMDLEMVYDLMEIESACIKRNIAKSCDRDCGICDLVQKDVDLLVAYETVKAVLNEIILLSRE